MINVRRSRQAPLSRCELLVHDVLLDGPGGLARGLKILLEEYRAIGGVAGVMREDTFLGVAGNPHILFAFGKLIKTSDSLDLINFFKDIFYSRHEIDECRTGLFMADQQLACCGLPYTNDEILGIVLWGDRQSRFDDLSLLRIYSSLLVFSLQGDHKQTHPKTRTKPFSKTAPASYIFGASKAMALLHQQVDIISKADFPVLLLGETGVGKEYIAQIIHSWSNRSHGPFIPINCAAIPAELLEAELFGIGKGVASGVLEREGYFQQAEGGVLFLDEIAELQPALQAKLLRGLPHKEIQRVGGAKVPVNVRIISATNADLRQRMSDGRFRPDLYYRLAGFEVNVPPLRERREDIALFIEHFIRLYAKESGKVVRGIALEALETLNEYLWPGNVRELEFEIRRAVCLCPDHEVIDTSFLSPRILSKDLDDLVVQPTNVTSLDLVQHVRELERLLISRALSVSRGNHTQAARLLGISRNGLASKMERLV